MVTSAMPTGSEHGEESRIENYQRQKSTGDDREQNS